MSGSYKQGDVIELPAGSIVLRYVILSTDPLAVMDDEGVVSMPSTPRALWLTAEVYLALDILKRCAPAL